MKYLSDCHVLVVDDDKDIRMLLDETLAGEGALVSHATTRAEVGDAMQGNEFDLVLLDLGLPDGDGIKVLLWLRQTSIVPVIIISGRSNDADQIMGLELGADDYVIKPFKPRILLARIRNILNRFDWDKCADQHDRLASFEVQGWRYDPATRQLASPNDQRVVLTPSEYRLLRALSARQGEPLSRDEISITVFGRKQPRGSRSIDSLVSRLRAKLNAIPCSPLVIQTVHGGGYLIPLR